jgi:hypothetical protein
MGATEMSGQRLKLEGCLVILPRKQFPYGTEVGVLVVGIEISKCK